MLSHTILANYNPMQQTDVTIRKTECTPFTQKGIQQYLVLLLFTLLTPALLSAETNDRSSFFSSLLGDVKQNVFFNKHGINSN